MLTYKYRFHSRGGVNYVYQKGKTLRSANLSLIFAPNERGFQRFAVVVSKKVHKSAVGRNRIRRRFYEAIRLEFPVGAAPQDYVFVVHNDLYMTSDFSKLRTQVRELLDAATQV